MGKKKLPVVERGTTLICEKVREGEYKVSMSRKGIEISIGENSRMMFYGDRSSLFSLAKVIGGLYGLRPMLVRDNFNVLIFEFY